MYSCVRLIWIVGLSCLFCPTPPPPPPPRKTEINCVTVGQWAHNLHSSGSVILITAQPFACLKWSAKRECKAIKVANQHTSHEVAKVGLIPHL